jgi:predicted transcriptional regulator
MAIRQFILKPKPTAIVLCLKDTSQTWYPSKLAVASGASYVYVTHWLTTLEKAGWVRLEKKGRLKVVVATEQGAAIASMLDELVKKIESSRPAPMVPASPETPVESPKEKEEGEKEKADKKEEKAEKKEKEAGEKEKGEKKEKAEKK